MAANKTDETLIDVADAYSKTENFVNKNGKNLTIIVAVIIGAILAYFAYQNFIIKPKNEEAAAMMWKAEYYFGIDSMNLALNGDGNNYGFLEIMDSYGGTPSGNLATYYSGLCYLNMGEYESAIDMLESSAFDDLMVESTRLGSLGDSYVQLGDYATAASYYEKSVAHSDNEFTAPIYLKKAGLAYEEMGDPLKALDAYARIKKDYSGTNVGRDIEKYVARATAAANK
ncbi:MAG: tetratricopeptide repeat protein [Flavobacteriales bacterium]|nr:tetratricopeptide repeat protein [Flavobacteriales bacterium]NNK81308.1 tetratricopeptide repeat protein [Flavobacteriales bacterium]